jgi:hypothetical protein
MMSQRFTGRRMFICCFHHRLHYHREYPLNHPYLHPCYGMRQDHHEFMLASDTIGTHFCTAVPVRAGDAIGILCSSAQDSIGAQDWSFRLLTRSVLSTLSSKPSRSRARPEVLTQEWKASDKPQEAGDIGADRK